MRYCRNTILMNQNMLDQISRDDGTAILCGTGLGTEEASQWLERAQTRVFGNSELSTEARDCGRLTGDDGETEKRY